MKLRRLNDEGLQRMHRFLDALTSDPCSYPVEVLTDDAATTVVQPEIEIAPMQFRNRFELGQYLSGTLADAGIRNIDRDRALWAWLALFYFEQLCPPDRYGRRNPGERARWVPETANFRKYYRHLLAGPFRIFRAHRDDPARARALLCTPVGSPGDVVEQLASRQELVTNPAIMQAASELYVHPQTGQHKRGAAGRGPGSARRLAEVLNQFDVTWDLYSMSGGAVLKLLPDEFERFKPRD